MEEFEVHEGNEVGYKLTVVLDPADAGQLNLLAREEGMSVIDAAKAAISGYPTLRTAYNLVHEILTLDEDESGYDAALRVVHERDEALREATTARREREAAMARARRSEHERRTAVEHAARRIEDLQVVERQRDEARRAAHRQERLKDEARRERDAARRLRDEDIDRLIRQRDEARAEVKKLKTEWDLSDDPVVVKGLLDLARDDRDRVLGALEEARKALRLWQELFAKHPRWCGFNKDAPGDSIVNWAKRFSDSIEPMLEKMLAEHGRGDG